MENSKVNDQTNWEHRLLTYTNDIECDFPCPWNNVDHSTSAVIANLMF